MYNSIQNMYRLLMLRVVLLVAAVFIVSAFTVGVLLKRKDPAPMPLSRRCLSNLRVEQRQICGTPIDIGATVFKKDLGDTDWQRVQLPDRPTINDAISRMPNGSLSVRPALLHHACWRHRTTPNSQAAEKG